MTDSITKAIVHGNKITVSSDQYEVVQDFFIKATGLTGLIKFLIAGMPDSETKGINTSDDQHPNFGDTIVLCESLLTDAIEICDFIDVLSSCVVIEKEKSQNTKRGKS